MGDFRGGERERRVGVRARKVCEKMGRLATPVTHVGLMNTPGYLKYMN